MDLAHAARLRDFNDRFSWQTWLVGKQNGVKSPLPWFFNLQFVKQCLQVTTLQFLQHVLWYALMFVSIATTAEPPTAGVDEPTVEGSDNNTRTMKGE